MRNERRMSANSADLSDEFSFGNDDVNLRTRLNTLSDYIKTGVSADIPNDADESQENISCETIKGNSISLTEFLSDSTYVKMEQLDSINPVVSPKSIPNQTVVKKKYKAMFVTQPRHYRSRYSSEIGCAASIRCDGNNPITIEITGLKSNHKLAALVRIHCVQSDDTYKSHPNNAFIKEIGVTHKEVLAKGGVVTFTSVVTKENNQILLSKLAILRASRNEIDTNLTHRNNFFKVYKNTRQESQIKQCVEQSDPIDNSQFRICAEVLVERDVEDSKTNVKYFEPLEPIFSEIISDIQSKPPLQIVDVSDRTTLEEGGKQVFIMCNKIDGRKEDVAKNLEVHLKFGGTDQPWGKGKITMIHHQVTIATTLPTFPHAIEPDSHHHVKMALYRKSKGSEHEKYSNHVDMVYYSGTLNNSKCMNPQEMYYTGSIRNSKSIISPKSKIPCVYSKPMKQATACGTNDTGNEMQRKERFQSNDLDHQSEITFTPPNSPQDPQKTGSPCRAHAKVPLSKSTEANEELTSPMNVAHLFSNNSENQSKCIDAWGKEPHQSKSNEDLVPFISKSLPKCIDEWGKESHQSKSNEDLVPFISKSLPTILTHRELKGRKNQFNKIDLASNYTLGSLLPVTPVKTHPQKESQEGAVKLGLTTGTILSQVRKGKQLEEFKLSSGYTFGSILSAESITTKRAYSSVGRTENTNSSLNSHSNVKKLRYSAPATVRDTMQTASVTERVTNMQYANKNIIKEHCIKTEPNN